MDTIIGKCTVYSDCPHHHNNAHSSTVIIFFDQTTRHVVNPKECFQTQDFRMVLVHLSILTGQSCAKHIVSGARSAWITVSLRIICSLIFQMKVVWQGAAQRLTNQGDIAFFSPFPFILQLRWVVMALTRYKQHLENNSTHTSFLPQWIFFRGKAYDEIKILGSMWLMIRL